MTAVFFSTTIFVAAALLFCLEPMAGKMLLPTFGGTPAVWNVCLTFFQAALLAGYSYAHCLTRVGSLRTQALIHLAVMILPWLALPFDTQVRPTPSGGNPTWPLLVLLATTAGPAFFVVASTSPLVGQWFAMSHRGGGDPYWLYAASNAGSMAGLLAYPFMIEPRLALAQQSVGWSAGYGLLLLLLLFCMALVWRSPTPARRGADDRPAMATGASPAMTKLRWVALAFVPSSLLLSVTTFLSSDISPVPFIWIVPLGLYLLSFVLVFSRLPRWVLPACAVALPFLVLTQIYQKYTWILHPASLRAAALAHLAGFFCAAMVCHGELARLRPAPERLTSFYFWVSLGGVLGGCFNAFLAPLVFNSLAEYPLVLCGACLVSPLVLWRRRRAFEWLDAAVAAAVILAGTVIVFSAAHSRDRWPIVVCLVLAALTSGRPVAFGMVAMALFAIVGRHDDRVQGVLSRQRDFYGVLKIMTDDRDECFYLAHGRIIHGQQRRAGDRTKRNLPLSYFHPTSPIGRVFAKLPVMRSRPPVAVIGLGVGTLAHYGRPGQEFVFYEIDPAVERIARDERYFTYLRDSPAECRVVLGDARLSLNDAPDGHYGLIVIDAFSGDGVPVHLMTDEAMRLYLRKLSPHGAIVFQLSNRFLDLSAVLGNLAHASSLAATGRYDSDITAEERAEGKTISQWGLVARNERDFGELAHDPGWQRLIRSRKVSLWTDQHTSLWPITHWRQ